MKDKTPLIAALIIGVALILFACAAIALIFIPQQQPGQQIAPPAGNNGPGSPPQPPSNGTPGEIGQNISDEDRELWKEITRTNVESICLEQAREEAGASAFMVKGCVCTGSESEFRKTYECEIATLDTGTDYFANIDCFLVARMCNVDTNYGRTTLSFEYLKDYQG